jgi:hypothetical protein
MGLEQAPVVGEGFRVAEDRRGLLAGGENRDRHRRRFVAARTR